MDIYILFIYGLSIYLCSYGATSFKECPNAYVGICPLLCVKSLKMWKSLRGRAVKLPA